MYFYFNKTNFKSNLHSKNLEKKYSKLNSNIIKDPVTGMFIIPNSSNTSSDAITTSLYQDANTPIPLSEFGIDSYSTKKGYYEETGGVINRSDLPLNCLVWWTGNPARISLIKIDGKLTSYSEGQLKVITKNVWGTPTQFAEKITFNNDVISNLSNGMHTVIITCSSENKGYIGGTEISDEFTFDLEN